MPDWETVRALGSELPEVEEGGSYGTPALKVHARSCASWWRLKSPKRTLRAYDQAWSGRVGG